VQGLIDEYEPSTASEHLLIQQVAMGWLRLHRLWGAEAAIANQAMLRIERSTLYLKSQMTRCLASRKNQQFT